MGVLSKLELAAFGEMTEARRIARLSNRYLQILLNEGIVPF
jgi:hypothetical protein